jgi:formate-nitrite transporter family protein
VPDREQREAHDQPPLKPYREIFEQEIRQAEEELKRPTVGLATSGLAAGLGVGVSALAMAAVVAATGGDIQDGTTRLLAANAFTIGFIIVILAHTDLFTEYTTIAIMPILARRASVAALARLWGLVYVWNLIGAAVFAAFLAILAPALGIAPAETFHQVARLLVGHPWWVILLSAVLAGWLMGTLSWLIAASRDTVSQIVFIWLIAGVIGFAHLHHPITGALEVGVSLLLGSGVTVADGAVMLLWSTIGASLGGVLFAVVISYGHRLDEPETATGSPDRITGRRRRRNR